MKKILLIFAMMYLAIFSVNSQDWKTVKKFTPDQTMKDVLFIDADVAYTVSSLYNGSALNVKRTLDGGLNWTEHFTGAIRQNFRKIVTPNEGADLFIICNEGILMHSSDRAENWELIELNTLLPLRDIFFLNEKIGFVTSDKHTIYKTINGGVNWEILENDLLSIGTIANIYFLSENHGYIGGFNYFKETLDGGKTWNDVVGFENGPGVLYQLQHIQFLSNEVGYISGDNGKFHRTLDGGTTWQDLKVEIPNMIVGSLFSFKFLDDYPLIGYACGYHGLLIKTIDGGETWTTMTSDIPGTNTPDGFIFHAMDFFENKGLMVNHHGNILSYTDVTGVDNVSLQSINVYPNPSIDIISFNNMNYDKIDVINAQGQVVLTEYYPQYNLTVSSLNPGIYFLNFYTKEGVVQSRMVKE